VAKQSVEVLARAQPTVSGTADLPNGTEVRVTLSCAETGYRAERAAAIRNGRFQAGPFSDNGAALKPGTCTALVEQARQSTERPTTTPPFAEVSVTFTIPRQAAQAKREPPNASTAATPSSAAVSRPMTSSTNKCPCGTAIDCVDPRRGRYCITKSGTRTYH
jgi:hypothetical protein